MRNSYTTSTQYPALACSALLHASVLAWFMLPSHIADAPQQQVVDVSVVMISAPEPQQSTPPQTIAKDEPPPEPAKPVQTQAPLKTKITPPKKEVVKDNNKNAVALAKSFASLSPTSGKQSPAAKERVAAVTKPIYEATSLHNTPPAYPQSARNRGIEGNVMLEVDVAPDGAAKEVTIMHSSGYALLDEAAHDAITHWHFIPARRGDELVEAKVAVPVEFRLD